MSFDAFQRFGPPGIRCPLAAASFIASAHSRHGWPSSAFLRSGCTSSRSLLAQRRGHRAARHRRDGACLRRRTDRASSEPDALAVLVHSVAGDHAVARALVLHLQHRAHARLVGARRAASRRRRRSPAPSNASNHRSASSRLVVAGVTYIGGSRVAEQTFETGAPIAERLVEQRLVAEREQVERDVRRGDLDGELLHARLGRMLTQLQRVEVEAASASRSRARRRARSGREAVRATARAARGSSAAAASGCGSGGRARRRRGTRRSGTRPTSARRADRAATACRA